MEITTWTNYMTSTATDFAGTVRLNRRLPHCTFLRIWKLPGDDRQYRLYNQLPCLSEMDRQNFNLPSFTVTAKMDELIVFYWLSMELKFRWDQRGLFKFEHHFFSSKSLYRSRPWMLVQGDIIWAANCDFVWFCYDRLLINLNRHAHWILTSAAGNNRIGCLPC